jgi:hypothetical protein
MLHSEFSRRWRKRIATCTSIMSNMRKSYWRCYRNNWACLDRLLFLLFRMLFLSNGASMEAVVAWCFMHWITPSLFGLRVPGIIARVTSLDCIRGHAWSLTLELRDPGGYASLFRLSCKSRCTGVAFSYCVLLETEQSKLLLLSLMVQWNLSPAPASDLPRGQCLIC